VITLFSSAEVRYSKKYDDCMDHSKGITSIMLKCIIDEKNKQDMLLNNNYKKVIVTLNKVKKLEFKKSQRLWMKYRDAKCNFFTGLSGGTVDSLNTTSCFLEMTAVRVNELANFLME